MAGEDGDKMLRFAEKVLGLWATPVGDTPDEQIFDSAALRGIYDIEAFKQGITCLLTVEKRHCNFMGNMHGGCIGEAWRVGAHRAGAELVPSWRCRAGCLAGAIPGM